MGPYDADHAHFGDCPPLHGKDKNRPKPSHSSTLSTKSLDLAERHFSTAFHGLAKGVFVKFRGKIPNEEMGPPENQPSRTGRIGFAA